MKVPKEYSLLFIIGMFFLAGILDFVVVPLDIVLPNPYHFFTSELISKFPFTTISIVIKSIALFLSPLWLMSFFGNKHYAKPIILLVWATLIQLYAVQDVVTRTELIPLEWALSLTASGFALLFPTAYYFIKISLASAHRNLSNARMQEAIERAEAKEKASSSD